MFWESLDHFMFRLSARQVSAGQNDRHLACPWCLVFYSDHRGSCVYESENVRKDIIWITPSRAMWSQRLQFGLSRMQNLLLSKMNPLGRLQRRGPRALGFGSIFSLHLWSSLWMSLFAKNRKKNHGMTGWINSKRQNGEMQKSVAPTGHGNDHQSQ